MALKLQVAAMVLFCVLVALLLFGPYNYFLVLCGLVLYIFPILLHILTSSSALLSLCPPAYERVHARCTKPESEDLMPSISILKPLHGVPELLEHNLRTFFELKYPRFELFFCVDDAGDPACKLVKRLMADYPHVNASLKVGKAKWGINPKLCNMGTAYECVENDLFWIADANIVASDCALVDMVDTMVANPNVGLVHQLPWMAYGARTVLPRWYFATGHARGYLFVNQILRREAVNGMSNVIRKSTLDSIGGLKHFAQYIAEDCEFGTQLRANGYRVRMSSHPALQFVAETTSRAFMNRMVRWQRIRYNLPVLQGAVCFEWLIDTCFPFLLITGALLVHFNVDLVTTFLLVLAHSMLWAALDDLVLWYMDRCLSVPLRWRQTGFPEAVPGEKAKAGVALYWFWWLRELMSLVVTFDAMADHSHVNWGGRTFQLHSGPSRDKDEGDDQSSSLTPSRVSGTLHHIWHEYVAIGFSTDLGYWRNFYKRKRGAKQGTSSGSDLSTTEDGGTSDDTQSETGDETPFTATTASPLKKME